MALPPIRSLLPRSLFGRALTILLVPIVVLQLVVGFVFFQRHYLRVSEQMTRSVAYELAYAANQIASAEDPSAAARRIAELALPLGLQLRFVPDARVDRGVIRDRLDFTGVKVAETLDAEIDGPLRVDLEDPRSVLIEIQIASGVLRAIVPRDRVSVSNPHQLLVLMILVALLLTAAAVIFLRNQVRPIGALAEAAEAFGKGRSLSFRPAGAEEVRRAGAAFLAMRARLERQIEQRTQMLSGVSHDLRTPITRMKLTLELMDPGDEVNDLRQDVDQMEQMLGAFLAFARGDGVEATVETDPFELAEDIADDARRAGAAIALLCVDETGRGGPVELRRGAVARAVQNLLGNAARHGTRVAMTVRLMPRSVAYIVEDDGPGIPEEDRARALQPFTRLDSARNLDSGGRVGLGLSIALDVARSHGGSLELGQSADLGGLRATLRLPR